MQRRGTVRLGTLLAAIVMALSLPSVATAGATSLGAPTAFTPTPTVPVDDAPDSPPGTVTDFYPESANLSDCVGLVEKPGCGSESRGGSGQTLVFVVLFAGLGVVLWRVTRGIKTNRAVIDGAAEHDTEGV